MDKLDLTKLYKTYYSAPNNPQLIDFAEEAKYIMLNGQGSPDSAGFANSVEALYTVAYGVKAIHKKLERDFTVARLEGLWWVDSEEYGLDVPRDQWLWSVLIRMPDYVTAEDVEASRAQAAAKKRELADYIANLRFDSLREGPCVQMMHIGPYSTEPETLDRMYAYMKTHNLAWNGLHHEIYLSDPRRARPSGMKTILRQPVKPMGCAAGLIARHDSVDSSPNC